MIWLTKIDEAIGHEANVIDLCTCSPIYSLSLIYRFFVNHKHFFDAINLLPHAKFVTSTLILFAVLARKGNGALEDALHVKFCELKFLRKFFLQSFYFQHKIEQNCSPRIWKENSFLLRCMTFNLGNLETSTWQGQYGGHFFGYWTAQAVALS